ncbi:unnamed protein product [Polarella glacialis]|uniref:Uncharacterized protein n=1 Tax=Polarella glacialis TaxID=89957 RepID=A0A813FSX4_POLGL|nr:unnamed protein product [Polarella glacialis]|mmetsp:Transcript_50003/g.81021  ORF Transcript_50003/g.81021 Transcript_50003/m.81021 type:complete len:154 (-) Transcript_50003:77-538(-)
MACMVLALLALACMAQTGSAQANYSALRNASGGNKTTAGLHSTGLDTREFSFRSAKSAASAPPAGCNSSFSWDNIWTCKDYYGGDSQLSRECCDSLVQNVTKHWPWWAWVVLAVGSVALVCCIVGCLCRLGLDLLKCIICCPCRMCMKCFGRK